MKYTKNHIPASKQKRPGIKMSPTSITVHSTGNPSSTAANERGWLTNPSNTAYTSWHIVVDAKEAIEAVPLNEISYHAGNRNGNYTSIGVEICESGDRQKTLNNSIELLAKMLYERGWGVDKLKRHYDWSGKICPRIMYDGGSWASWNKFKSDVNNQLAKLKSGNKGGNNVANKVDSKIPSSWAKTAWDWGIKNKITDGSSPKRTATREEMITMIYRATKK